MEPGALTEPIDFAGRVQIVEAQPDHHPLIAELTLRSYEPVLAGLYSNGFHTELADVAGRAKEAVILAALFDGFVIGGVTSIPDGSCVLHDFSDADAAGFRHLAVDPSAQRLGAGRALVEACIDRARRAGRSRLLVRRLAAMEAAGRLYARLGFERDEAFDAHRGGELHLAYRLELDRPIRPSHSTSQTETSESDPSRRSESAAPSWPG